MNPASTSRVLPPGHDARHGEFSVPTRHEYDRTSAGRWIHSHIWQHRRFVALALVCYAASSAAGSCAALLAGRAAHAITVPGQASLALSCIGLFAALALEGLCLLAAAYSVENVSSRFHRDAQQEVFLSILGKGQAFHSRFRVGDLVNHVTNDALQLCGLVSPGAAMLAQSALATAVALGFLCAIDPELLVVPLAFSLVNYVFYRRYLRELGPVMGDQAREIAVLSANFEEVLSGIEAVKVCGRETFELEKHMRSARELCRLFTKEGLIEARYSPLLLFAAASGSMFLHAFWMHQRGSIALGDIVAVMGLSGVLRHASQLSGLTFASIQSGVASAERMLKLMLDQTDLDENVTGYAQPMAGDIAFDGVSLCYGEQPALQGICLNVQRGQTVAILGATGSGKTSLTRLVNRTHAPTVGRVLVDGVDTRDWNLSALRSQIGKLEQDVFLFPRSIAENIAFAKPSATRAEIEAAARDASAHEFIINLPHGYDTLVGQRGVMLSGGQRQRIGLARAYLSDPRILILDDSTSAVDVETESHMQRALHRVRQGRTTLLITHRLAHARWVDRVVVLDQGKLVAEGSHDELIASSAIYRRMFAHHDVNLPALELPAAPQNMLAVAVQASGAGPAAGVGV